MGFLPVHMWALLAYAPPMNARALPHLAEITEPGTVRLLASQTQLPVDTGASPTGTVVLVSAAPATSASATSASADGASAPGEPIATVVRTLAEAGSARASLWRIVAAEGHLISHSAAALAEADAWLARPGVDDAALTDLTHLPFVTIDNAGSRDLDQAVHVARAGSGFRLRYALADASYYVRPGTALFDEALSRGTSYYLPGFALPMLPRVLSEGLISLNPRVDRRSLVMDMQLDADGRCTAAKLVRARVHSRAKLTYAGVQAMYACGDRHPMASRSWAESLHALRDVGRLRLALARARDVVTFQRTEVDVQLDGAAFSLVADRRLPVERYNEQVSLLCNMEGARLLTCGAGDPDVHGVFKVHPAPPAEKLGRFERLIDGLIQTRGLDRELWGWKRGREALADYLDRLPRDGPQARVRAAIERQAMMANVSSTFSDAPAAHHGVGAAAYARFSAPMREIVGVFTHKEALEQLGLVSPADRDADLALRERVIAAGNAARNRQARLTKAVNALVLDTLLGRELRMGPRRPWRVGTLLGMSATKLYVQLDAPPVEVKVYLRDVQGSRARVSAHGACLQLGDHTLAVGDAVELRAEGRSERSGRWTFAVRPAPST